jgi:hypothetical protein
VVCVLAVAEGLAEALLEVGSVIGDFSLDLASWAEIVPGMEMAIDAASSANLARNRMGDRSEFMTKELAAVVKMHLAEERKVNSLDELNAARFDFQNCEHFPNHFRFATALPLVGQGCRLYPLS